MFWQIAFDSDTPSNYARALWDYVFARYRILFGYCESYSAARGNYVSPLVYDVRRVWIMFGEWTGTLTGRSGRDKLGRGLLPPFEIHIIKFIKTIIKFPIFVWVSRVGWQWRKIVEGKAKTKVMKSQARPNKGQKQSVFCERWRIFCQERRTNGHSQVGQPAIGQLPGQLGASSILGNFRSIFAPYNRSKRAWSQSLWTWISNRPTARAGPLK